MGVSNVSLSTYFCRIADRQKTCFCLICSIRHCTERHSNVNHYVWNCLDDSTNLLNVIQENINEIQEIMWTVALLVSLCVSAYCAQHFAGPLSCCAVDTWKLHFWVMCRWSLCDQKKPKIWPCNWWCAVKSPGRLSQCIAINCGKCGKIMLYNFIVLWWRIIFLYSEIHSIR